MKWFQHQTNARRDPVIREAVERFGPLGYYAYFVILELMGENFDLKKPGRLVISEAHLRSEFGVKYGLKSGFCRDLLDFYQMKSKLSWEVKGGVYLIYLPKFKDYTDKYTRDKMRRNLPDSTPPTGKFSAPDYNTKKRVTLTSSYNNTTARAHARHSWHKIKDVLQTKLGRKKEETE